VQSLAYVDLFVADTGLSQSALPSDIVSVYLE